MRVSSGSGLPSIRHCAVYAPQDACGALEAVDAKTTNFGGVVACHFVGRRDITFSYNSMGRREVLTKIPHCKGFRAICLIIITSHRPNVEPYFI